MHSFHSIQAPKPAKDEFDSDTDEDDVEEGATRVLDDDDDDSDFEDPDLIPVAGGGTSLQTLKNIKGGKGASGSGSNGKGPAGNGAGNSRGLIGGQFEIYSALPSVSHHVRSFCRSDRSSFGKHEPELFVEAAAHQQLPRRRVPPPRRPLRKRQRAHHHP